MPYDREVRLGLVLYGGVSLAVYENGIAQELYRCVRGDGVYGLIKELTGSDIIVDIISGTSAGGVNGVMLSYALANGRDFTLVGDLWRNQADIDQLLRKEDDDQTQSILDSDWYEKRLKDCFELLRQSKPAHPQALSPIDELDLFVTGTDANGAISTVYDDNGHPIDVKNHRALFQLSFREGRTSDPKNNLKPCSTASLAKLCRLTSCFPVAFAPVPVGEDDKDLNDWRASTVPAVYLDGGILNNKPFTSTIDAIRRRTANRDVERFLIYVEPDPERFDPEKAAPQPPGAAQAALLAAYSIPSYQSIGADLAAVEAHNERAERIETVLKKIRPAKEIPPAGFALAPVCPVRVAPGDTYLNCRFIQLRDKAIAGILNTAGGRLFLKDGERRAARILVESFNYWDGPAAETLQDFDIYYRQRRVQRLSDVLMQLHKTPRSEGGMAARDSQDIWDLVNHFIKLYEILQWAMKSALDKLTFSWERLSDIDIDLVFDNEERKEKLSPVAAEQWGQAERALSGILDTAGIRLPIRPDKATRSDFHSALEKRFETGQPNQPAGNLLHALDRSLAAALKSLPENHAGNLLRGEYSRFLYFDRLVFPLRFGGEFENADAIRVVRFSPIDAQRGLCRGTVSEKVCGRTLGAFGGFFKKSWRANDILIGRMDGACQLTECILTRERLAKFKPTVRFDATKINRFFKKMDADKAHRLAGQLNNYLNHASSATLDEWSELVNQVVAAAHGEIVAEEWPRVLDCSIEQEYLWGQYRRNDSPPPEQPYDPKRLVWTRAHHKPDRVLVALATAAIKARNLPPFQPRQIPGHPFAEEIPEPILTELGLLGAIRASKSLLASLPKKGQERIESNSVYKNFFSRLLPAAYNWAAIRRRNPDSVIVLNTIVPTACVTVFLMGILFAVKSQSWSLGWKLPAATMGGSALCFAIWVWLFSQFGHRHSLRDDD